MPLYQPPNINDHVLSQFSLRGKVVAVTGGSGGIGVEIVKGLAEAGADVALTYNTSVDASRLAEEIAKANHVRVQTYQLDVTRRDSVYNTMDQIVHDFGKLDVVVANAGVCSNVESLEYTDSSWSHINKVNYDGVMWTAMAAGKIFKRQKRGNLIITASVSAMIVNKPQSQAAYNASKAAVAHLGRCLAVEWVDFARVNCVSPGYVNTAMTASQPASLLEKWMSQVPGRRMAQPAELKSVYVFLASDACCYMTGANILVDGAYTAV